MELLTFIASLFIIALWILWIILPFAIFRIRKESIKQTKLLESIIYSPAIKK